MTGIRINTLDQIPAFDELLGNYQGSTGRLSSTALGTQLAASGPIADAIAARALSADLDVFDTRLDTAEGEIASVKDAVAYASLLYGTWAELESATGAGEGQKAEVTEDTGTHGAASATGYDGASVENAGTYRWDADWARWVRVGDTGLAGVQGQIDTLAERSDQNNGTKSILAFPDGADGVIAHFDAKGNFFTAADPTRAVNDRGVDAEESAGKPIVAFQDKHRNDTLVQQSDGRFWSARDGYGFEKAASRDIGKASAYDIFGETNKAHFLRDRAASARGNQVIIDRICCTWNEDPLTNFARMATALPLTDTTGIMFFVQRRDIANNPDQTGERGLRLVMRTYAIDYEAQDITFSATTVLDEPPQWESDGLGKSFPCSAIKISGGPNDGRILILYMVLDSATGLQEAPSELDLYKKYSDDDGATWSARELVFDASDAYAALGIAQHDGVSGYGPAGNYLLQLPADHPVAPGRIVAAAPITSGTTSWHQGCIYSDDYGETWTHGTYQQIASTFYNEASLSVARDDSLVMFVRTEEGRGSSPFEHTPGRGAFRSTDGGATFTYLGYNETAGFNNCASALLRTSYAPKDGWPKMLIGGPQTVSNDRRNYRLRVAYDETAQDFVGEWGPFPDEQGISYTHLSRMENGLYLMAYETFPVSFNTQSSVGLLVFNEAALMAGSELITE